MRRVFSHSAPIAVAAAIATAAASSASANVILEWNDALLDSVRALPAAPPAVSRYMAMLNTAVYDAVNAASGSPMGAYAYGGGPVANASPDAAAAAAAHTVLLALYPTRAATINAALAASLAAIAEGPEKANGIALGNAIGTATLAQRLGDGASAVVAYVPGAAPGDWQPTLPAFAAALLPQWPNVTPWTMTSGAQFRPAGPPALGSAAYATALNETKSLGSATSLTRTADQTEIALFWADGPGTATPPGHWIEIAMGISAAKGLSTLANARLFALLAAALADAAIVAWDAKYVYELWRPVTAIQNADLDGNPATEKDATWTPLIATPPFPEYTSGHSTFSGAAAEILTLFFGDGLPFTTSTDAMLGVLRDFEKFWDAAEEAGRSRIFGGIHYEFANEDGLESGRALANYVFANFFLPEPATLAIFGVGIAGIALARRRDAIRRACG